MKVNNRDIKAILELCNTIEDADLMIRKYTEYKTVTEKLAFLKELYDDIEIINEKETDSEELIYELMLLTVIRKKYK